MTHADPQPSRPPYPQPRPSFFLRFVAVAVACCLMPIFVFGATVAATGTMVVSVHEPGPDGIDLWIPVPALLVDVAVFVAPRIIPAEAMADIRREVAPYRESIEMMADQLEAIPAGSVLVEVEGRDEHVKISKTWRSFEISVDSDEADVKVSVPARLLGRSLDFLGG